MVTGGSSKRMRRSPESPGGWIPTCPACTEHIEECECVCPYCGERESCHCCIGYGLATGGG